MLFVQVSVGMTYVVTKKIASACIDYIIVCAAVPHPWNGCCRHVTKFKTTKINFEGLFGLSTEIRPHENYPPYGNGGARVQNMPEGLYGDFEWAKDMESVQ